jgi:hypothetical protein
MEKDKYKTDVIFRVDNSKDWKGTVYALMPHDCCDHQGHVSTYQHVGQHSGAEYRHCIAKSRPATPKEYKDLKREMEQGHGYNFNVVKKQNYDKYLKSYYEVRGVKR